MLRSGQSGTTTTTQPDVLPVPLVVPAPVTTPGNVLGVAPEVALPPNVLRLRSVEAERRERLEQSESKRKESKEPIDTRPGLSEPNLAYEPRGAASSALQSAEIMPQPVDITSITPIDPRLLRAPASSYNELRQRIRTDSGLPLADAEVDLREFIKKKHEATVHALAARAVELTSFLERPEEPLEVKESPETRAIREEAERFQNAIVSNHANAPTSLSRLRWTLVILGTVGTLGILGMTWRGGRAGSKSSPASNTTTINNNIGTTVPREPSEQPVAKGFASFSFFNPFRKK